MSSSFEDLEIEYQLFGTIPEPVSEESLSDLLVRTDLIDQVFKYANQVLQELGFEESLETQLEQDRELGSDAHYVVEAVVGDDEAGLCTAKSYGPVKIAVSHVLSSMKVSLKDTAFSSYLINYAEGFIIVTPTSRSGFHYVNSRAKMSGVPLVFDPVKLKLVSPVRKQSAVDDMDIESKYKHLAVIAAYADKDWITFHSHQAMLILACTIFDFRDGNSFPYLFPTEGGCGGIPPYSSIHTAKCAMFHFNRGKSTKGILGTMKESNMILTHDISPQSSFFLRNIRMSTADIDRWKSIRARFLQIEESTGGTETEVSELVDQMLDVQLPESITQLGSEVNPEHWLMGYALSRLRRFGFIMTDLDVKVALQARERYNSIIGTVPFQFILESQELELQKFKSKTFETLSSLVSNYQPQLEQLDQKLLDIPDLFTREATMLMAKYYQQRLDSSEDMSSFIYTTSVRVYDHAQIKEALDMPSISLYKGMGDISSRTQSVLHCPETIFDRAVFEEIKEWYEKTDLKDLVQGRIPSGLFVDDPRIVESVNNTLRLCNEDQKNLILIVISSDMKLHKKIRSNLHLNNGQAHVKYVQMDLYLYMDLCISTEVFYPKSDVKFYSIISRKEKSLPKSLYSQLTSGVSTSSRIRWSIEYDFPNIEKGLGYLKFLPASSQMKPSTVSSEGGFLRRESLRRFKKQSAWGAKSIPSLYKWPDFQTTSRHHPYQKIDKERIRRATTLVKSLTPYSESSWLSLDSFP